MDKYERLNTFISRMKKLDIDVKLSGNYPWIYIDTINGKRVTERFLGNHGFTIAFLPLKPEDKLELTDIKEIMNVIRKYK
jgi:hypothetical protein